LTFASDLRSPSAAAWLARLARETLLILIFRFPHAVHQPATRVAPLKFADGPDLFCHSERSEESAENRSLDTLEMTMEWMMNFWGTTLAESKSRRARSNSFRAEARVTFVLAKVTKTAVA